MTDEIIVSKSELDALFEKSFVADSWRNGERGEVVFVKDIQKILDNAQVVNSEPRAWIEHHKGGDNLNWQPINHEYSKATPLYTDPQPAPDTVPKAEYDKLLEALKGITKYDKPMPDPHVHGWEVFAKAAMEMASDNRPAHVGGRVFG